MSYLNRLEESDKNTLVSRMVLWCRAAYLAALTSACAHIQQPEQPEMPPQTVIGVTTTSWDSVGHAHFSLQPVTPPPRYWAGYVRRESHALSRTDEKRHEQLLPLLRDIFARLATENAFVRRALADNVYSVETPTDHVIAGSYYHGGLAGTDLINMDPARVADGREDLLWHEVGHDLWQDALPEQLRAAFVRLVGDLIKNDFLIGADNTPHGMLYCMHYSMEIEGFLASHQSEIDALILQVPGATKADIERLLQWYLQLLFSMNHQFYSHYHTIRPTVEASWQRFLQHEVYTTMLEFNQGIPALAPFYDHFLSPQGEKRFYANYLWSREIGEASCFLTSGRSLTRALPIIRSFIGYANKRVVARLHDAGQNDFSAE